MENLNEKLEEQLKEISALVKKSNKSLLKFSDLPKGHIHVSKSNGVFQYYYVDRTLNTKKYISGKEIKLIKRIMQRDYELAINKRLKDMQNKLQKFLKGYDVDSIERIFVDMNSGRKILVTPFIETSENYIQSWYEENPGMQNPFSDDGVFLTNRGELVRSKSEKIIADALDKYNVPYQYEPMLELGHSTVYPDFITLNVRKRQTMYWEHLGIVSDLEYASKNFMKIQQYEKNGYMVGRDLICTMESVDMPLEVKNVEQKIKEFLL